MTTPHITYRTVEDCTKLHSEMVDKTYYNTYHKSLKKQINFLMFSISTILVVILWACCAAYIAESSAKNVSNKLIIHETRQFEVEKSIQDSLFRIEKSNNDLRNMIEEIYKNGIKNSRSIP